MPLVMLSCKFQLEGFFKITILILLSFYCYVVPAVNAPAECGEVHGGGELILPLLIIQGGGLLEKLVILSLY
jgi:hypothetical protein